MRSTGFFLKLVLVSVVNIALNLSAGVIDNRYLPQFDPMYLRKAEPMGSFDFNLLAMSGERGHDQNGKKVNYPEIFGKYNLSQVSLGLQKTQGINFLRPEWQPLNDIIWDMEGKLQAQGAHLGVERQIADWLAVGMQFDVLHVSSRIDFLVNSDTKFMLKLDPGSTAELYRALSDTNRALGLAADQWSQSGISDIDLYLRFSIIREYVLKCRQVDAGVKLGTYLPSGVCRDLNNPASIPFGGNGHTGIYIEFDLNLEVKEDWFVGLWAQVVHRLPLTQELRMPAASPDKPELITFGTVTGRGWVDVGTTFGIQPFLVLRDLSDGFGVRLAYTYRHHSSDWWADLRSDKNVATYLNGVRALTEWQSEYVTIGLIYNLWETDDERRGPVPMFYLNWDQPVGVFGDSGSVATHRATMGIEVDF